MSINQHEKMMIVFNDNKGIHFRIDPAYDGQNFLESVTEEDIFLTINDNHDGVYFINKRNVRFIFTCEDDFRDEKRPKHIICYNNDSSAYQDFLLSNTDDLIRMMKNLQKSQNKNCLIGGGDSGGEFFINPSNVNYVYCERYLPNPNIEL